jgi:fumarate reductase subunit D
MTRAAKRRWSHPYEHRTHHVLPWPAFLRRAAGHIAWGLVAILTVDGIGTLGYHRLGAIPWIDAFLNASMILGGMGPVDRMETSGAKLFSALYALFSGLFFIAVMGVVLAPWIHRMIHVIHAEEDK